MPIYQLNLIGKRQVAESVIEFTFTKPENFNYVSGQYGGFTLVNPKTNQPMVRRFSLLSSPHDSELLIATRMQPSEYKEVLAELPIGSSIKFAGPMGDFILAPHDPRPIVMLAGGIGITPFYSMLRTLYWYGDEDDRLREITLFYGGRSYGDTPYLSELAALAKEYPCFRLIPILQDPPPHWAYATGIINLVLIQQQMSLEEQNPLFCICGSPGMVNAMKQMLSTINYPSERIMSEDFPGYGTPVAKK